MKANMNSSTEVQKGMIRYDVIKDPSAVENPRFQQLMTLGLLSLVLDLLGLGVGLLLAPQKPHHFHSSLEYSKGRIQHMINLH